MICYTYQKTVFLRNGIIRFFLFMIVSLFYSTVHEF